MLLAQEGILCSEQSLNPPSQFKSKNKKRRNTTGSEQSAEKLEVMVHGAELSGYSPVTYVLLGAQGPRSHILRDEPRNRTFIPHGRSLLTPQHNRTGVLETLQCKSTPSTQISAELTGTDNRHKGFWRREHQLVDFCRWGMRVAAKPPRRPSPDTSLRNGDL